MKAAAFFSELKRRNVLRAAAFYAAAVWALAQGLAQLLPLFGDYNWIARWFVIACILGFPFWTAFAWFYEFTPQGLKRESEIAPGDSIARSTGRKLDFWIIGILAVAVVLLVTNQFVLHRNATGTANTDNAKAIAAELAKIPDKSVAVLPLSNESGDPKQQYFSDGLSEELISDLTQINGLKVIGKYSSFKFRDSKDSSAQIGATLGVAHLIQGSVRQQGDRIRVTVGLIRAADGSSVWSHTYDEQLKDVFAIQTQIGQAIAAALKITLLGQTLGVDDKPPSGNVESYRLMLQARALTRHMTEPDIRQSIALVKQAIQLDPDYAHAWSVLSNASMILGGNFLSGGARQQAYMQAREAADKELSLAPDAAVTHMNRGQLLAFVDNDSMGALAEYRRALALAPNDGTAMDFLANGLQIVGQLHPAVELYRKAIATDPLRTNFYSDLAATLLGHRELDAAERVTRDALALQPDYPGLYGYLTEIDILRDDAATALRDAKQETDATQGAWAQALAKQIAPDRALADAALQDYLYRNGETQPYFVADLYALRKEPDQMFDWLQRAWTQHDPNFTALLYDPFVRSYHRDPRFAALCKQAGLPPTDQPLSAAANSSGLGAIASLTKHGRRPRMVDPQSRAG